MIGSFPQFLIEGRQLKKEAKSLRSILPDAGCPVTSVYSTTQRTKPLCRSLTGHKIRCVACARRCTIHRGKTGFCRVRTNVDDILRLDTYGRIVAAHVDTIEKKPMYHYRPGSKLLSIATVGCNWSCDYCVNPQVSQADEVAGKKLSPEDVVALAEQYRCQGIAYTYNEPLVFIEFARDIGIFARRAGLFNVVVTNGYGTPEAVDALAEFADCVTVGLKANASSSFLRKHSGVPSPKPIFRTLLDLKKRTSLHVEISNLVLGQHHDTVRQTKVLSRWLCKEIGADTPLHFVRFYPSHRMASVPATPSSILEGHCKIAKEAGLRYVYVANFPGHERENTGCPNCGAVVVARFGYDIRAWRLDDRNRCKACGYQIPIVGGLTETPPEERYVPVVFPPMDMLYVCEGLSG